MSFILDALKKSEAERRQGEVPRLQNEPFSAAPRRRRPIWPFLLVLALLLNGVVFGWWLLAREEQRETVAVAAGSPERVVASGQTASAEPVGLSAAMKAEPVSSPGVSAAPPLSPEPDVVTVVIEETPVKPVAPTATPAPARAAEKKTPMRRTEPPPAAPARSKVAVAAPAAKSFPPISELPDNVRAGLPRLDLHLHFFTPDPERRLVRLNGLNLREGGSGGDGLSVVEFTQDGVRLSYGGTRFFLPAGRP
jgi:general secretion pathway protein B